MRDAVTRMVAVGAPAPRVLAYLAQAENLPEWCRAMLRIDEKDYGARPGSGAESESLRPDPFWADVDRSRGTVDYFFKTPGGIEVASARVFPLDGGAQVVLTIFEPPASCATCGTLKERVAAAEVDLMILKAILEGTPPAGEDVWH
jgi:hypothetical protein